MDITAEEYLENNAQWYEDFQEDLVNVKDAQIAISIARMDMETKAVEAFKDNCQHPKDTEPCECKLCVRWVGGHCELLDGFIEKLNSNL